MKAIKIFFILFSITLFLGCEKWLDVEPEDELISDEALQTTNDVRMLLNSVYTVIGSSKFMGGRIQIYNELYINTRQLHGINNKIFAIILIYILI